jgi:prolipoprotein diacylglyceryltransferase
MKTKFLSSIWNLENPKITDEVVEYYRKNPDELDLIVNKEEFHVRFLAFFFILGLTLTIGARVISYFFKDYIGDFLNHVVLDVVSELGIAVFGGALTAYFLEYLHKQQYKQNMKFRNEIKKRLDSTSTTEI